MSTGFQLINKKNAPLPMYRVKMYTISRNPAGNCIVKKLNGIGLFLLLASSAISYHTCNTILRPCGTVDVYEYIECINTASETHDQSQVRNPTEATLQCCGVGLRCITKLFGSTTKQKQQPSSYCVIVLH